MSPIGALVAAALVVAANLVAPSALDRYLAALHRGDYVAAYGELAPEQRQFFGSSAHFASTFTVDRAQLEHWRVVHRTASSADVDEQVAFEDPLRATRVRVALRERYTMSGAALRIPARPRRAYAPGVQATNGDVRLTLLRIACDAETTRVVLALQNDGAQAITALPYGRSVLRVDGAVVRPLTTRAWQLTDRRFFLGVRLAPHTRIAGVLTFPRALDGAHVLDLHVAPIVRDGENLPRALDVRTALPA